MLSVLGLALQGKCKSPVLLPTHPPVGVTGMSAYGAAIIIPPFSSREPSFPHHQVTETCSFRDRLMTQEKTTSPGLTD